MTGDIVIGLIIGFIAYMAITLLVDVLSELDKRRKK
jgi:hypothetical protein